MERVARVAVLEESTRLGRYDLGRELGSGGMGSVVEATHRALGKRVAIKRFHPHLAARAESLTRFVREGRAIAGLRHPNIVEVFDLDRTESGVPYLVMELLEGSTLAEHLSQKRPLSLSQAVGLTLPLASALGAAHSAGIVHRDVKPSNIFLRGGALTDPCLVDFGVSKHAAHVAVEELTQSGTLVGSYPYFSPEHTRGGKHVTPQSDLYSLAAVLYECTTGAPPFEGESAYALMHTIATQDVTPPSAVRADLPREFDEILMRAMERDPRRRYATMRSFASALLRFADRRTWHVWSQELIVGASMPAGLERTANEEIPDAPIAPPSVGPIAAPREQTRWRARARFLVPGLVLGLVASAALLLDRGSGRAASAVPAEALAIATVSSAIVVSPPKTLIGEKETLRNEVSPGVEAPQARPASSTEPTGAARRAASAGKSHARGAVADAAERGSNGVPILE